MGILLGSTATKRVRPVVLGAFALFALLTTVAACGDDDNSADARSGLKEGDQAGAETTVDPNAPRPCAESRHLVVFDILGTIINNSDGGNFATQGIDVDPIPGSVEVANAWRERGYEILYISTLENTMTVPDGRPLSEAFLAWFEEHGYPSGDGTHIWLWDGIPPGISWTSITDELLRFAGEGVTISAGYSENGDKAYAYSTAGIPPEYLFSMESVPVTETATTPLVGDSFTAHLPAVQALPPVCQAS